MVKANGFDNAALNRLVKVIEKDIQKELYDGASLKIAQGGEVVLDVALGYADRAKGRELQTGDIFKLFSLTKAFTNVLVLQAIDRGDLALTTPVVDILPEFWGSDLFRSARKNRVNIGHLLTHRSGLPATPTPVSYEEVHDLTTTVAAICQMDVVGEPGIEFSYSPAVNHALLGEIARRVAGGSISVAELMQRDIFEPLGMTDSGLGVNSAKTERMVPTTPGLPDGGWLDNDDVERVAAAIEKPNSEMPWVGGVSTSDDLFRFAEMLRMKGRLDGKRLLSPSIISKATVNQTGDAINSLYRLLAEPRGWETPPGNMGLGFACGGAGLRVSQFGTLTSPTTFGNFGAGSTLLWVDPENDVTFVCLTSKIIEESDNIARFQRISDLVASALN